MAAERIFNPRSRRVLRTRIPGTEIAASVAVLTLLAGIGLWVAAQRDRFDPADRDLSYELLAAAPVRDTLYRQPLRRWTEPGAPAGAPALQDLGVFPATVLEGGWRAEGRVHTYTPDTLYRRINGEAEKFVRQGNRALHHLTLVASGGEATLSVELFDQGSLEGSLGAFSDHAAADRVVEQRGASRFFRTAAGAIGMNGRWFYRIAGSDSTPMVREKALQLISALADLPVAGGEVPFGQRALGAMNISPANIAYQADNVFQFDFAKDFWFGAADPEADARLFVHRAASSDAAEKLARRIIAEQSYDYEPVWRRGDRVLFRHAFLASYFALDRVGTVLFGVENVPDAVEAEGLMERFGDALRLLDPEL